MNFKKDRNDTFSLKRRQWIILGSVEGDGTFKCTFKKTKNHHFMNSKSLLQIV